MKHALVSFWTFLRELATDNSYERYLAHHDAEHPNCTPLTRRAFYLSEQQHKWTGVSRCC